MALAGEGTVIARLREASGGHGYNGNRTAVANAIVLLKASYNRDGRSLNEHRTLHSEVNNGTVTGFMVQLNLTQEMVHRYN